MNRTIEVRLIASTAQFQAAMGAAAAQTKAIERDMRTMAVNGDQSMRQLGKGMLVAGGLIAGGLAVSVGKAMEFEREMRNVNSIAKMSETAFRDTGNEVLALSRKVPQSAATLAQGLYDIASSGFAGADGMKILEASAIAATAGMTSSDVAAKAITATLNAYGRNARDAGDISDVLFKTVEVGVITFEELASGMGDWIGMAAAAKVPVDEAAAAIAAMTLVGVPAAESGTSLNRVFQSLISPSEELADKLRELGYESGAQALETDGLRVVMDKIRESTGGNIEAMTGLFTEQRALRGALALTANEGRNFAATADAITDTTSRAGAAKAAYAEQSKALAVQLELAKSSASAFAIEVGNRMLPILGEVVRAVAGVFDGFSSIPAPVLTAGTAIAGLTAVALTLGGGLILLAPRIHATNLALQAMGPAGAAASRTLGLFTKLGAYGAAFGALTTAVMLLGQQIDKLSRGAPDLDRVTQSLLDLAESKGSIDAVGQAARGSQQDLRQFIDMVASGDRRGMQAGRSGLTRLLEDIDSGLANLVEGGAPERAAEALERFARAHDVRVDDLLPYLERYRGELDAAAAAGRVAAAASDEVSAASEEERRKIDELGAAIGDTATKTEDLSEVQKMLQEQYEEVGKAIDRFSAPLSSYEAALEHNKGKAEEWADAQNTALDKTKVSWEDYPGLVKEGLSGEALDANRDKAREWAEAQNESIGEAKVGWEDFPGGVIPSLAQVNEELIKNQQAFANWHGNLAELTKRGRGDLALELGKLGPEAAPLVQAFVDETSPLFDEAADNWMESTRRGTSGVEKEIVNGAIVQAAAMRQGAGATVESLAAELEIAPEVVRRVVEDMNINLRGGEQGFNTSFANRSEAARREMAGVARDVPPLARGAAEGANRAVQNAQPTWGQSWADRYRTAHGQTAAMRRDVPPIAGATGWAMSDLLAGGLPRFQQTVGGYAGSLESGIRTVAISAAARAAANLSLFAEGGIVDFYANGGLKESHQAQIARAGDWRVWAEPETGGESYIPLAPSKRDRSLPIWYETGRRLGLDEESLYALREASAFHDGGMWNVPRRPDLPSHGPPIRPRGEATMDNMQRFAEELARKHMELPHHQAPPPGSAGGLAGSTTGLNPEFLARFMAYSARVGPLRIVSGFRSSAQQARLYAAYLAGTGNLAAPPGRSKHERGLAIDHSPVADASMKAIAQQFRLHYPVRGEPWHVEPFARGGILNPWVRDAGGPLMPGYTLNGSTRPETVIPTPVGPGASAGGTSVVNNIKATYELHVEGEITDRTERKLRALFDEHDRELASMIEAGIR